MPSVSVAGRSLPLAFVPVPVLPTVTAFLAGDRRPFFSIVFEDLVEH
jgi:hypothetical protein